jgi:hypothetical protein
MRCWSCGTDIERNVKFCQSCGQELSTCAKCGVYIKKDSKVCERCGGEIRDQIDRSKFNIRVAAIITVMVMFFSIFGIAIYQRPRIVGEYPNLVLYRKDGNVYMTNFAHRKATPIDGQITSHNTRISKNGKRFFYKDDADNTLRYVELPLQRMGGVVDKGVRYYRINDVGNIVYYIKGNTEEGKLYKSDLASSKLIIQGVEEFRISPDGSKLLCMTKHQVYLYKNDSLEFSSLFDSNLETPVLSDINLDIMCFIKDRKVYVYKDGKVNEIYNGAAKLLSCLQDGRVYFLNMSNSLCYYDLNNVKALGVYNDIIHADMKEPVVVAKNGQKTTVVHEDRINTYDNAEYPVKADVFGSKVYVLCWDGLYVRDLEKERWELYDNYIQDFGLTVNGDVVTLKHPNSFNVSLFVNNLLISDYTDRQRVYADDEGNIIYQTVGNEKALYIWTKEGSRKITDNFESFFYNDASRIYYIKRTSGVSTTDLYLYDGEVERVVVDKVYSIIAVREENYGFSENDLSANYGLNIYNVFDE